MAASKIASLLVGILLLLPDLAAGSAPAHAGDNQWTTTSGPPGLIYAVALDPVTPGIIYTGTSTAGVFKSTDGGLSWASKRQGLDTRAVFSLVLDPTRPNTLYAGTNLGVYRSDDGALTWVRASSGILADPFGSSYIYTLTIDPLHPATVYAGSLLGIFKSQDGGQTWQEKNNGLRIGVRPSVEALALDPQNTEILYAGAGYSGLSGTLFKSQNGGESWAPLTVGLSDALISSIAVSPFDTRAVYAGTRGQGVFASADGGRTWQRSGQYVLESNIAALGIGVMSGAVYAAGMRRGFYRSSDGGRTWEETGEGIGERNPFTLALDPNSSNRLWLGGAGGLYRSDDRGSHWSESGQGIAGAKVVALTPNSSEANTVYAGVWTGGVYKTSNGGVSWQAVPLGVGLVTGLAVDPLDPNLVYAGMVYLTGIKDDGLYLSRDSGRTWQLAPLLRNMTVSVIATAPGKVYVGTDAGLYISDDSGATWKQPTSGLPTNTQVAIVATHSNDPMRAYATLDIAARDVYASTDGGRTWAMVQRFQEPVSFIAPSPASPGLVYVVSGLTIERSSDGGRAWQLYSLPTGEAPMYLVPHPVAPNTLYLGASNGVFRSLDGAKTWSLIGLQEQEVAALSISPADPSQIFAGTLGSGVWSFKAVPALKVEPERLAFLAEPGGTMPGPASIYLSDESGGSYGWSSQSSSSGNWLSLSPSAGVSLPVTVSVSVNTSGLSPAFYTGTVTFTSTMTGTTTSPWQVPVSIFLGRLSRSFFPRIAQGQAGW